MKQRTKYIATFLLGSLGGSMLGIVVACVAIYVIAMAGMSHQPDQQAMRASQQMSKWSQADVDNLWIEGKAVWDRYKDTSAHVATDDAPTLLRDNEWKIRASPNGLSGFLRWVIVRYRWGIDKHHLPGTYTCRGRNGRDC